MPTLKSKNKHIGISLGDPFGIGPEIVATALSRKSVRNSATRFTIIGDHSVYRKYCAKNYKNCHFLDLNLINEKNIKIGQATSLGANASLKYLNKMIELKKMNHIDAIVTAPLCKETISKIDRNFIGHTEYLAEAFKIKNVGMMFVSPTLKTIIVTRHIALKDVPKAITPSNIFETIELTNTALKKSFKIRSPKIAVCGLNPHAGEGGLIGKEEAAIIIPALKKARRKGINVFGPAAADTLFSSKINNSYDAIVAMYHDQGLIPVKTMSFNKLVNLTIGLPFIRTSPAHGTAFNIAGKNIANAESMCESIKLAAVLS